MSWLLLLVVAQADGGTSSRFETMVTAAGEPIGHSLRDARMQEVGARTAVEALDYDPSIHATAGARGERIITLRGFAQRQLAVLLDGAPFEIPYDGQIDLDMVPAAMLERIDVAPGPTSVLAGPNGLGGVVDLRTRRAGRGPLLLTQLEVGDYGRFEVNARSAVKAGPFAVSLFSGYFTRDAWPLAAKFTPTFRENGGARLNSDRRTGYVGAAASWTSGHHALELTGWFLSGRRGMPPSTLDDRPRFWRFTLWNTGTVQLGHRYEKDGVRIETMAWWRGAVNVVDAYDDTTFDTQTTPRAFSSLYDDMSLGVRTRGNGKLLDSLSWRFWVGVQGERHTSKATNDTPDDVSRLIVTAAPELEWKPLPRLAVLGGVQLDTEVPLSLSGAQPGFGAGPMLSGVFTPHDSVTVTFTAARRTRFPTLRERFSEAMGFSLPNPALRPEAAWHFGVAASWRPVEPLQLEASLWDAEVEGLIEAVRVEGGLTQLQNISQARMAGGELSAGWRSALGRLRAGYVLQSTQRLSAPAGVLEYRPMHQAVVDGAVTPWPWLEVWAGVRVMSERAFTHPDTRVSSTLPAAAVLDARVELGPASIRGWVRVTNLLDADYSTEYGFPMPGRQVMAGLTIQPDVVMR